jgi:hypothetical protein
MGRLASTPKRSANPAGVPNAHGERPEELAFSVARIEKPQRKLGMRERKSLLTEHRKSTAWRRKAFGFKAFS